METVLASLVLILLVATSLLLRQAAKDRRLASDKPGEVGGAEMRDVLARLRRQSVRVSRI